MTTQRNKATTTKSKSAKRTQGKSSPLGRPARLSREAVLEAAIKLIDQESLEAFTLTKVAQELDTVAMAIYNYFPSRTDLLAAVADHLSMQFKMPAAKPGQTWQDTLRTWLNAFKKYAERYPVIFKALGGEGQTSAGWLRVTMPVGRTLQKQGMEGRPLAMNSWLFCTGAISLVQAELTVRSMRSPFSLTHLAELEPDEQNFGLMVRQYHAEISSNELFEAGFKQLIRNLEFELQEAKAMI